MGIVNYEHMCPNRDKRIHKGKAGIFDTALKRVYDRVSIQDQYSKWHQNYRAIGWYCKVCGYLEYET